MQNSLVSLFNDKVILINSLSLVLLRYVVEKLNSIMSVIGNDLP